MDADMPAQRNAGGPHPQEPILAAGPAPQDAPAVIVFVHGRGGSAQGILSLYDQLGVDNCAAIAPQAAGHSWYPHSFLAPLQANQPYLDLALQRLECLLADLAARGVAGTRIILLGFSQGACLALEFAARHPRPYGAVLGLSGGLIGPARTPRHYPGSLAGTRVFLGSADPDPHVPLARVEETRRVLRRHGGVG